MKVKVRKVGNSMVLTVPNGVAEEMALYEGQELEAVSRSGILEYKPVRVTQKVDWDKYRLLNGINVSGNDAPETYIRKIRATERDPWND